MTPSCFDHAGAGHGAGQGIQPGPSDWIRPELAGQGRAGTEGRRLSDVSQAGRSGLSLPELPRCLGDPERLQRSMEACRGKTKARERPCGTARLAPPHGSRISGRDYPLASFCAPGEAFCGLHGQEPCCAVDCPDHPARSAEWSRMTGTAGKRRDSMGDLSGTPPHGRWVGHQVDFRGGTQTAPTSSPSA